MGSKKAFYCLLPVLFAASVATGADLPYTQQEDFVIGDVFGLGLPMDIFVPTGEKNGLAVLDIASGAWHSDRGKIRDHKMAQFYDVFCRRGYTVFAVRPGSVTKFTALDMVANVNRAIRYIKAHSAEYGIDPNRLGLSGASAGAHLAALTTVYEQKADPGSKNALKRPGTAVKAVALFFPPTNFLQWGDKGMPEFDSIGNLLFSGGMDGHTPEEIRAQAEKISPALNVKGKTPPFVIWHGDADPLVPLQQSAFFVEKLKAAGTDVEFHIKAGGGHPWLTIPEEVAKIADWFDGKLAGE